MTSAASLPAPPLQRFYDLKDLSEAGDEVVVAAKPAEFPALAEWLGVDAVERFEATVTLRRLSHSRFLYEAVLGADVVQSCVVSLEPVASHVERSFTRTLHLIPRHPRGRKPEVEGSGILTLGAGDDEVPEELESPRFDLAAPLLEEALLGIEPYPRAEGVAFKPPEGVAEPPKESPFAALKRLKQGDG